MRNASQLERYISTAKNINSCVDETGTPLHYAVKLNVSLESIFSKGFTALDAVCGDSTAFELAFQLKKYDVAAEINKRYERVTDHLVDSLGYLDLDCVEALAVARDNYMLVMCEHASEIARYLIMNKEASGTALFKYLKIFLNDIGNNYGFEINVVDANIDQTDMAAKTIVNRPWPAKYKTAKNSVTLVHMDLNEAGSHFGIIVKKNDSVLVYDSMIDDSLTGPYSDILRRIARKTYGKPARVADVISPYAGRPEGSCMQITGGFVSTDEIHDHFSTQSQNHFCYLWATLFFALFCIHDGDEARIKSTYTDIIKWYTDPLVFIKMFIGGIMRLYFSSIPNSEFFWKYLYRYTDEHGRVYIVKPSALQYDNIVSLVKELISRPCATMGRFCIRLNPSLEVINAAEIALRNDECPFFVLNNLPYDTMRVIRRV